MRNSKVLGFTTDGYLHVYYMFILRVKVSAFDRLGKLRITVAPFPFLIFSIMEKLFLTIIVHSLLSKIRFGKK